MSGMKTDPPKLSEIQVGHPAPATRAAYRATDERRLRQSASSPGLPAVPQLQARPTASTSPVSRRAFETRARTPDGGGKLIVAIRPPSQPALRSPASKPLRSPPSQPALQRPAWYPADLSAVTGGDAGAPPVPTRPATSHEARSHRSPQQGFLSGEHAPAPLRRPQSVHGTRGGAGEGMPTREAFLTQEGRAFLAEHLPPHSWEADFLQGRKSADSMLPARQRPPSPPSPAAAAAEGLVDAYMALRGGSTDEAGSVSGDNGDGDGGEGGGGGGGSRGTSRSASPERAGRASPPPSGVPIRHHVLSELPIFTGAEVYCHNFPYLGYTY